MYDIVLNIIGFGIFVEILLFGLFELKKHVHGWKIVKIYCGLFAVVQLVGLLILLEIHRLTFDIGFSVVLFILLSIFFSVSAQKEIKRQAIERFNN